MISLNSREKCYVLSELLKFKETETSFTEGDYDDIFHNINLVALENYLIALSKKGIISFVTYAEDGYATEFTISNIKHKEIENEISSINLQYKKSNSRKILITTLFLFITLVALLFHQVRKQ